MKKSYIILIIIVIAVLVGYFGYAQYNTIKTQEAINASQDFKDNATNYFNQAVELESAGDYAGANTMYQKSTDDVKRALASDNQSLTQASGVYREYLNNEIQLLEKMSQLLEYKIYRNNVLNNSLNPGQEKVEPDVLTPYIDKLTREVADLKAESEQIIRDNPEAFAFLNP
jgi:hypothetical protein